jgi:PAS domain S-box-containing protein
MLLAEFFIPHGHCYLWKPELVGLHIASDALTALAYYSIPITLTYFVAKRRDVPFNWIFLLFSAFIISCGTTHILEIWTLWHPDYWLSGWLKALTAVVSIYTAVTLIGLLPQALAIPTTAHLEKEIKERQRAEAALLREKTHLAQAQKVAGVGSWEFDLATQKITWSDEIFRIFGLDRKQPTPTLSRHWQQIYPEDRKVWKTTVRQLARGKSCSLEFRIVRPDGSIRHVLTQGEPIVNEKGQVYKLFGTVLDISDRVAAQERERLVGKIALKIRESLELCAILKTTVTEVRRFLQTDRVLIYCFNSDWSGEVVVESVGADFPGVLDTTIHDSCFGKDYAQLYQQGRVKAIANIYTAGLKPCCVELLASLQVKANLIVPILVGEKLWGLLIAHHCRSERQWQSYEIDLLKQLATQMAIALQQSELYSRVQAELIERQQAEEALREKTQQLEQALKTLQRTQAQLVQNEKMVSLGQLVAGIAHEINNPTSFIYGNIYPASEYAQNLLDLIELYQQHYPEPVTEIAEQLDRLEVDFIAEDFPKLLTSMKEGAYRISEIVQSLRNFSRLDEMECKQVDIHEGIDNTLLILKHRLTQQADRPEIQVVKEYTELPLVECYPGQLNQVFMNILCNAIDALEDADNFSFTVHRNEPLKINYQQSCNEQSPMIRIHTEVVEQNWIAIRITDNGPGLAPEVRSRIFDPFFTTKPPGKGTGLGLSISYQIVVDKHNGQLTCHSVSGQGAEFVIELPIASYYGTPRQYTQPKASEQGETKHIVSRKYSQLFLEI